MYPKKTILATAVLILATLLLRYLSHGEEVMLRKAFSKGFLHEISGVVVFIIGFAMLFLFHALLARYGKPR